jgi:O-antigen biosynthesis protein
VTAPGPMAPGRFCFVVTELLGHRTAGGIATATTFLAELLAAAGHEVTLFDASSELEFLGDAWASRYRRLGITVEPLRRAQPVTPPYIADSYRTYHQLRDRDFDVIVFQDWCGLGFCSMMAKHCGLAFGATRLVHIVHGPTEWLIEANQSIRLDAGQFAVADIERRAAELADTVVGPSRYLLDWMGDRWRLGPDRRQIFYPTARMVGLRAEPVVHSSSGDARAAAPGSGGPPSPPAPTALRELVFFGRYEERKGIRLLADALNLIGADRLNGIGLTFLGRAVPYGTADVEALLDDDVRAAVGGPAFLTGLDSLAARSYLAAPGRVALIPSLIDNSPNVVIECIEDGISFLAAASGGIPELVHPEDRRRVLFEPTPVAFAERLGRLLDAGTVVTPARQGWVDE